MMKMYIISQDKPPQKPCFNMLQSHTNDLIIKLIEYHVWYCMLYSDSRGIIISSSRKSKIKFILSKKVWCICFVN
jgi:hypothetical protein